MNARRLILAATVACAALLATGCVSLQVGTAPTPARLQVSGLASGYVSLAGLRPYDGTILDMGLFNMAERPGELVSLDLWPVFGFGVGVVGARAHLLMLDVGLGVLWYQPKPRLVVAPPVGVEVRVE